MMLQYVTEILGFGFLGLSFLMLYLGFRAMQTVNKRDDRDPQRIALCRFFLVISLIFMIVAGPLQFGLLYVSSIVRDRSVALYIGVPPGLWETEFGDINMLYLNKPKRSLINVMVREEFKENDQVIIDVSDLLKFIYKIRGQVQAAAKVTDDARTEEIRALNGG